MDRRLFLSALAGTALLPRLSLAATGTPYTPGLVDEELAAGKTVFLDFYASWCTTCRAQGRVISALLEENPAYGEAISFISVDWDVHRGAELTQRLQIPRRSTLVVLKGDEELGRIVAGTSKADIQALLDTALAASA